MQHSTQVSMNDVRDMAARIIRDEGFTYNLVPDYNFPNYSEDEILALGGSTGVTDWPSREVQILNTTSEWHQMRASVHELAHIILRHGILSMVMPVALTEIEAETATFLVLSTFGFEDRAETKRYLNGWSNSSTFRGVAEYNKRRIHSAALKILALMIRVPAKEEVSV